MSTCCHCEEVYLTAFGENLMLRCDRRCAVLSWVDHESLDCLQGKTNFFERRVGEYQRAGVMANCHPSAERYHDYVFRTDVDF